MGDGKFKLSQISDSGSSVLRILHIGRFILLAAVAMLLAFLALAWRHQTPAHPSQVNGSAASALDQLSTDGGLEVQAQLDQASDTSASNSASSTTVSQGSASVSVDGQTVKVTGDGAVSKTIKTPGSTTDVNISVQGNNTSVNSSTKLNRNFSNSNLRIHSNSSVEVGH